MKNKLIMFYGSVSGGGKSTLAYFTDRQLKLHGINTRCIHEAYTLHIEAFAEYMRELQSGEKGRIDTLLTACEAFVKEWSDEVVIMDSIFPCSNWLFSAGYSKSEIKRFNEKLNSLLRELTPLLIYVHTEVEAGVNRAAQRRGKKWLENMIREKGRTRQDLIDYFTGMSTLSRELLADWPFDTLFIDTTVGDWESYEEMILQYLSLPRLNIAHGISPAQLKTYIGKYKCPDDFYREQLHIQLVDDGLFVNAGWQAGSRLMPETDTRFHLEATGSFIEFQPDALIFFDSHTGRNYRCTRIRESNTV